MKSSNPYAGCRYPGEGSAHAFWLWHRFCLSSRDAEDRVAISGECRYLGRAAKHVFMKLLKGLRYVPRVIVTDKLRNYGTARKEVLPLELSVAGLTS